MALLEVKNIGKKFGGLQALDDISLSLSSGEIMGIIGPNGAGKTTFFNILTGFIKANSGEILFKDQSLVGMKPHKICRLGMTRTFQIVRPFMESTVLDNVIVAALNHASSLRESKTSSQRVIELVGLQDKQDTLASGLSLPDRKKLELARALATAPDLLLLDEVMAGINPTETDALIGLIQEINRNGVTVLLIEHVMRAVMALSHRVVVFNFGAKIAEGEPLEIVKNPEVIKAYLGEDFEIA